MEKHEFREDHPYSDIDDRIHFLQWPDTKTHQYLSVLTASSITLQQTIVNASE